MSVEPILPGLAFSLDSNGGAADGPRLAAARGLVDVGRLFYDRGWSVGTSSNYSVVLSREPMRLLLTVSGKDKGALTPDDFVLVDEHGKPVDGDTGKPSAETLLHTLLARRPGVGAVLHTHSVWSTILSDLYHVEGGFAIEGYEMLKGLDGVTTHEHCEWVTVVENTQDIADLARRLSPRAVDPAGADALQHGFLIRRHGMYTWGRDLAEARRHVEIFEFLFEVLVRRRSLAGV